MWLPLAAKHTKGTILPPLDIHWVWHCHLLSPIAYRADCESLVGGVVPHKMEENDAYKAALLEAAKLWKDAYPNEPFQIQLENGSWNGMIGMLERKVIIIKMH